jgi:hypothetical protein
MKITFISYHKNWCHQIKQKFQNKSDENYSFEFIYGDIRKKIKKEKGTIFVTPSNSLGSMKGGFDLIMSSHYFPGIEKRVKNIANQLNIIYTNTNRKVLPIGSSFYFNDINIKRCGLIVSPIMYYSQSIAHTENVYISYLSSLKLIQKMNDYQKRLGEKEYKRIIFTAHGCGNGNMEIEKSIEQFEKAWNDKNLNVEEMNVMNESIHVPHCIYPYEEEQKEEFIDENDIKTIHFTNINMVSCIENNDYYDVEVEVEVENNYQTIEGEEDSRDDL